MKFCVEVVQRCLEGNVFNCNFYCGPFCQKDERKSDYSKISKFFGELKIKPGQLNYFPHSKCSFKLLKSQLIQLFKCVVVHVGA
jgi:hypothetical protein